MKNLLLAVALVLFASCKNKTEKTVDYSEENLDVTTSVYPENISKIFEAHGGLDTWNSMQSLVFTMPNPKGDEIPTTDLKNRRSLIEMPKHTLGFNGTDVWLHSKDTTTYKGNARFYYNLMVYFYAMPFILADDGINYNEAEPLVFEGKSYPGIKISYESGIGESPEDEYVLYYDPETYKMTWLSYTVTFFSKEKSEKYRYIKYSNWETIEGLLLPETLTWYHYENGLPTKPHDEDVKFTNIKLSTEKPSDTLFKAPEGATLVE